MSKATRYSSRLLHTSPMWMALASAVHGVRGQLHLLLLGQLEDGLQPHRAVEVAVQVRLGERVEQLLRHLDGGRWGDVGTPGGGGDPGRAGELVVANGGHGRGSLLADPRAGRKMRPSNHAAARLSMYLLAARAPGDRAAGVPASPRSGSSSSPRMPRRGRGWWRWRTAWWWATRRARVVRLDRKGEPVWRVKLGQEVAARPAVSGDSVLAGTVGGELARLGLADGAERWRLTGEPPVLTGLVADETSVYVVGPDGAVRAHALDTGRCAGGGPRPSPRRPHLEPGQRLPTPDAGGRGAGGVAGRGGAGGALDGGRGGPLAPGRWGRCWG